MSSRRRRSALGREAEIAAVRAVLDAGGSAAIVGPAGIGKTTVLRAALDGLPVRTGAALPSLRGHAYLPLHAALGRELAGTPDEVAASVAAELGGDVLVIEDLHWADPATVAAVASLAEVAPVAVTSRPEPAWPMDGHWGVVQRLGPLRPRDAAALARRLHPDLDAEARALLVRAAEGNPLLLELLPSPNSPTPTVTEAVAARLAELPDRARHAVELLSLLGRPALPSEIELDDQDEPGGLVATDGDRISLRYAVVGETVVASLGPRRAAVHRRLAARLPDAEAARHHLDGGEAAKARERALAAAARTTDLAGRADLLCTAVEAAELLGDRDARLRLDAAAALVAAGRWRDAAELAAVVRGEPSIEAEAALHRGRALWFAGRIDEARDAFGLGRERASGRNADLDVRLAVERAYLEVRDQTPGGLDLARAAHELAEANGSHRSRAQATLGAALLYRQQPGWEALLETAARAAAMEGDHDLACEATYHLVSGLGFDGRLTQALDAARRGLRRSEPLGLKTWSAHFTSSMLMNETLTAGDREWVVSSGGALLRELPTFRNRAFASFATLLALTDLSRREDADAMLERLAGPAPDSHVFWLCGVTELGWIGRDANALVALREHREQVGNAYFGLRVLAEAAGQHLAAELDLAIPVSLPTGSLPLFAPALEEIAGLQRWRAGDLAGALAALDRAASRYSAIPIPRYAARAAYTASLLAGRAGRSDAERRRRAALAIAERHRLGGHVARLARTPRDRLSAREREVLDLVAKGRTSASMAKTLGIASDTVDQHVESARKKLGAATRREAAAILHARRDAS